MVRNSVGKRLKFKVFPRAFVSQVYFLFNQSIESVSINFLKSIIKINEN